MLATFVAVAFVTFGALAVLAWSDWAISCHCCLSRKKAFRQAGSLGNSVCVQGLWEHPVLGENMDAACFWARIPMVRSSLPGDSKVGLRLLGLEGQNGASSGQFLSVRGHFCLAWCWPGALNLQEEWASLGCLCYWHCGSRTTKFVPRHLRPSCPHTLANLPHLLHLPDLLLPLALFPVFMIVLSKEEQGEMSLHHFVQSRNSQVYSNICVRLGLHSL